MEFFLGTRSVCVDDTPPYVCEVLPNGDEVGDQILSAVVTSEDGQTAIAAIPVTVEKFVPELTIEMHKERLNKKKVKRTISGEVVTARPRRRATHARATSRSTSSATASRSSRARRWTWSPTARTELDLHDQGEKEEGQAQAGLRRGGVVLRQRHPDLCL